MKILKLSKRRRFIIGLVITILLSSILVVIDYKRDVLRINSSTSSPTISLTEDPLPPSPEITLEIISLFTPTATFEAEIATNDTSDTSVFPSHDTKVVTEAFESALYSLCWVAYAPTNFNPEQGVFPSEESLREDLQVLKQAGFNGLVTYGADQPIHQVAQAVGFEGMILGVWDPGNAEEMRLAKEAAQYEVVVGYVVGNEGLGRRYDYDTLKATIDELRQSTGKPVTTTEERWDYTDSRLMALGDWLFPNVHPYWHSGGTEPQSAVAWTVQQFRNLADQTDKPVLFKEVGLPTAGDNAINEQMQAEYYRLLQKTDTQFVFFEAYDQYWKDWAPVEPYWGLFHKDRSPKEVGRYVCGK